MTQYRIICPDCGAIILAATRLAPVFELCPKCKRHTWDIYDALLADRYSADPDVAVDPNVTIWYSA